MATIEDFLCEQFLLSDSPELDLLIAKAARNYGIDWLADSIEEELGLV